MARAAAAAFVSLARAFYNAVHAAAPGGGAFDSDAFDTDAFDSDAFSFS